jgi:hypothetical protein
MAAKERHRSSPEAAIGGSVAAVGASKHGQATEVLSTVTTAQENPPQVPDRGWRIVAGPELTPSQFHCAIVAARAAVDANDLINAAHWRAARAGERGNRRPDAATAPPAGSSERAARQAMLPIPDDRSIPAFLDRRGKA